MKSFNVVLHEEKKEDEPVVQTRIKLSVINKLKSIAPRSMSYNKKIRYIIESMVESGVQINFDTKKKDS